jgi:chaperonin GroES
MEEAMKIVKILSGILVKMIDQESKTDSGIVLPNASNDKPLKATVVMSREPEIKVGDTITNSRYKFQEIEADGEKYKLIQLKDVLMINGKARKGTVVLRENKHESKSSGGIDLVPNIDMNIRGVVVSSGVNGYAEGDTVLYEKYSGKHSGRVDKHLVTIEEKALIGIVEE